MMHNKTFVKSNSENFKSIKPFDVFVNYVDMPAPPSDNADNMHIHEKCEIYINISGHVSFMVENSIYPIVPGSILITRPFEYHHCIYHNNDRHKHFCIFFSCNENEQLFDLFFKRNAGEKNLVISSPDKSAELISLCHKMTEKIPSESEKYYYFFKLIHLLNNTDTISHIDVAYHDDIIVHALNYINSNLSNNNNISITELAQKINVSVNTLDRHFLQTLGISPSSYIKKRRLAKAARLLSEGATVTEASEESGFPDYSNFISLFKQTYGITPLKFKKSHAEKTPNISSPELSNDFLN